MNKLSFLVMMMLGYSGISQITSYPYVEDFESGTGGWSPTGSNSSWAHGIPVATNNNKILPSGACSSAWVTNLTGEHNNSENSQLVSPVFDFTSFTSDPLLRFDLALELESCCDEAWVEITTDGINWTKLGTSATGINWYNDTFDQWWDGSFTNSGEWRTVGHTLTGTAGSSTVQIRIALSTDGSVSFDGVGIDNIMVFETINEPAATALIQPTASGGFGATEAIEFTVTNNGSGVLTTLDACFSVDGGTATCETFAVNIAPGGTGSLTFIGTADLSATGPHDLKVYISSANDLLCNDSLITSIMTVTTVTNFPFIEDFESGNGSWTTGGSNNSWQYGQPNASTINTGAGCGNNVWTTNLTGSYNNGELSYIQSPIFDFSGLTNDPTVTFDVIRDMENCCDEVWMEYSTDGGAVWTKLGTAASGGTNWYNDATQNWWDNSVPWQLASHELTGLAGQSTVMLRFFISTDGSVTEDGFAFDNFIIHEGGVSNLSPVTFLSDTTGCNLGTNDSIMIGIFNEGPDSVFTFDVCHQVNSNGFTCVTISDTIAPGDTLAVTINGLDLSMAGLNTLDLVTSYSIDSRSCDDTLSQVILNTVVSASINASNVTCNGKADGYAIGSLTGASGTPNYMWSNMATTDSIGSLSPGMYSVVITDTASTCMDSATVTITEPAAINTGVTVSGLDLTADESGATYQWIDCDNGDMPISGETGQTYTATANGNYAVIVTLGGCSDTSACEAITGVSVHDIAYGSAIKVFPNPTTGMVMVSLNGTQAEMIRVLSIDGRLVQSMNVQNMDNTTMIIEGASGIYFVEILNKNQRAVFKLIKE